MNKKAFTLAEVLITLVIIGVIAAMTIPTLMGSTNDQEKKSALKKAVSAINQAISLDYALYGNNLDNADLATMLKNHMSVIDSCFKWNGEGEDNCANFKTADGLIYYVGQSCGLLHGLQVDVNGDKGPNETDQDQFCFEDVNGRLLPSTDWVREQYLY